jgi:hypothetical protein
MPVNTYACLVGHAQNSQWFRFLLPVVAEILSTHIIEPTAASGVEAAFSRHVCVGGVFVGSASHDEQPLYDTIRSPKSLKTDSPNRSDSIVLPYSSILELTELLT